MDKPDNRPEFLCMAPWTHTYISPQSERRLCCASREPAQNFEQYIDTNAGTGEYNPLSLDEWWNSEHVKQVRVKMMNGEIPDECQVCNHKLLNTDVYRSYFWHLFRHHYDDIWNTTDDTGYTTMKPVSWDYRFSNLCNFKCRQCGDMLSSSWESEQRKNNMIDVSNPKNNWMKKDVRKEIQQFQIDVVDKEFEQAVEEHRVEEIYWVGGEPLMMEEHWRYMKRIVELGDGGKVYARYNTNLSQIEYKGIHLYRDILGGIRDYQLCCSIDGTGTIGEYIRTGLNWDQFLDNYKQGLEIATHDRQMRLDFTLTLPGLFELKNMFNLSKQLNTTILSKVTFTFSPDIMMSPLMLPKDILHRHLREFLDYATEQGYTHKQQSMIDMCNQLYSRLTTQEQWPDEYEDGWSKGKLRIETIDDIRGGTRFTHIIARDQEIYEWYKNIR